MDISPKVYDSRIKMKTLLTKDLLSVSPWKKDNQKLEILINFLVGSDRKDEFFALMNDNDSLNTFVASALEFLNDWNLDGINISYDTWGNKGAMWWMPILKALSQMLKPRGYLFGSSGERV